MALIDHIELIELDSVSSTNDIVRRAISDGSPEGLVVTARSQEGGQGRRGNAWKSPEGGLYMSLLLDPDVPTSDIPTLGMVAAGSVCRVLTGYLPEGTDERFRVKWPNDVIVVGSEGLEGVERGASDHEGMRSVGTSPFRKICGISTELIQGKVCLGIGVNIERPRGMSASSAGMRNEPVYLMDLVDEDGVGTAGASRVTSEEDSASSHDDAGDEHPVLSPEGHRQIFPATVRNDLLEAFSADYDEWLEGSFASLSGRIDALSALNGCMVNIHPGDQYAEGAQGLTTQPIVHGRAEGIRCDGSLCVVEEPGGVRRIIREGSVSLSS